ncbi:hypothetical protein PT274_01380 [Leuconostocaceae bacterium ESL0958]|nr:hypothetical protein [Leuconostocaceae bacterium ESL0958]
MSLYKNWYLTTSLVSAMQSATVTNEKINFKYIFASSDTIDEKDYQSLTNDLLKQIKISDYAKVSSSEVNGKDAIIFGTFTNKGVTNEHLLNTLGIVAEYRGKEFLAGISSANKPFIMPKESDLEQSEYTIKAILTITNTNTIDVRIDPAALATVQQINDVKADISQFKSHVESDFAKLHESNQFTADVSIDGKLSVESDAKFQRDVTANSNLIVEQWTYAESGLAAGTDHKNVIDNNGLTIGEGKADLKGNLSVDNTAKLAGNLDSNSDFKEITVNGMIVRLMRFGNLVNITTVGEFWSGDDVPPWHTIPGFVIPVGFRPIATVLAPFENNFHSSTASIYPNGIVGTNNETLIHAPLNLSACYLTNDSWYKDNYSFVVKKIDDYYTAKIFGSGNSTITKVEYSFYRKNNKVIFHIKNSDDTTAYWLAIYLTEHLKVPYGYRPNVDTTITIDKFVNYMQIDIPVEVKTDGTIKSERYQSIKNSVNSDTTVEWITDDPIPINDSVKLS